MREFAKDKLTLVVDIGNTNIVCGIYELDMLVRDVRMISKTDLNSDEYFQLLSPLLESYAPMEIGIISIGSVVPQLSRVWMQLFSDYFTAEVYQITGNSPLGLSFRVSDPSFIGADLIANVFATWEKYTGANIILDLGTATKIQLVTNEGLYAGVAIATGLQSGADNLFEKAALLSALELYTPTHILANTTSDALCSGIVYGHALMLDAFVNQIKKEYSYLMPIRTILTGGLSSLVKPLMTTVDVIDPHLTLDGLYLAAKNLAIK